jgi:hypothetical protein
VHARTTHELRGHLGRRRAPNRQEARLRVSLPFSRQSVGSILSVDLMGLVEAAPGLPACDPDSQGITWIGD